MSEIPKCVPLEESSLYVKGWNEAIEAILEAVGFASDVACVRIIKALRKKVNP